MSAAPPTVTANARRADLLRTPHLPLLAALYTAQGLPYGFFTLALPVLMREAGWSLTALGFLQFLAAPWVLKMLWAPLVDHHGTRRAWLLSMQLSSCALALAMAAMGFHEGSIGLFVAVFAFNLLAATQDVATDGLAVRLLDAQQRGLANGIQVGAYRFGMVLGGGLLLWLFARTSWSVTFLAMAALLALFTLPVWRMAEPPPSPPSPDPTEGPHPHPHAPAALLSAEPVTATAPPPRGLALALLWWHRALRPGVLPLAGLIFCFRFGDQMASGLITPFLLDHGVDKPTLALMKGAVGSGTSLAGAALGGWLMLRMGRRQALLGSGLAQVGVFGLYALAGTGWGGMPLLWVATVAEGVIGTVATVALFSLMMDAADPAHAGTDYTLLGSVGFSLATLGGIAGGMVGDALGYTAAFVAGGLLSGAGVVALVRWLDAHPLNARVRAAWH
ncbi:MFS transporter [Aquabacterium sp.]|uniref:MFS transporter n=1 Tax=Aquabacterium sp. TaxID=1872578 RepID=UPI002488D508|nr:MFS transporter [Aquabacterium sp.]MDI1348934.1 MFS transporter [Aquabacterium sp.]